LSELALAEKVGVFHIENDEALMRFLSNKKESTASTYGCIFESQFLPFLSQYQFGGHTFRNFKDVIDAISLDFALPVSQKELIDNAILADFVKYLKKQDLSPDSIKLAVGAVQSAAKFWKLQITTKDIGLPDGGAQTESFDWDPNSIAIFNALLRTPRYRAFDAFAYQSGLAKDDVLARHYIDIKKEYEAYTIRGEKVFPCFRLTRGKTNVHHHTCISFEAMQLLKVHFDHEFGENGTPQPNDLIFNMNPRPINEVYVDRALKYLGEPWPYNNPMGPHSKRKAFRKATVAVGNCPSEFAEYFMGHNCGGGDMKKTYSTMDTVSWAEVYLKFGVPNLKFEILSYDEAVKRVAKMRQAANP
jgi:integrase